MSAAPSTYAPGDELLRRGEELWDPGTRRALREVGVARGWHCLEVGAGCGSVAVWMAGLVGPAGRVVATDQRTDRLAWCRARGVEVWQHDLDVDALPRARFDLVHARLCVPFLDDPADAVRAMAGALRPGGWLVLEDTDGSSLLRTAADQGRTAHGGVGGLLDEVTRAVRQVMQRHGYSGTAGLDDVELLAAAGLSEVSGEGRAVVVRGGTPAAEWYRLWIGHQLRPELEASGLLDGDRLDAVDVWLADPANRWLSQTMLTARGCRSL